MPLPSDLSSEPFDEVIAKRLIRHILEDESLGFTKHARDEMRKDSLDTTDIVNVLRAGWMEGAAEMKNRAWRYRLMTNRMSVIVTFRSVTEAVVVTAWRES